MSDYERKVLIPAIDKMLDIEGRILHNDPDDIGQETLCGISRFFFPNLAVWKTVDKLRREGKKNSEIVPVVMTDVIMFYKDMWYRYKFELFDPAISNELFDQLINPGPAVMATNIQRTINALNYINPTTKKGRILDEDLLVDGKYGKKTRDAILAAQNKGYVKEIVHSMNALQLHYYLTRTENRLTQRKFYVGWINNRCLPH